MRTKLLIWAAALAACGSDAPPPPSCQQAVGHYYGAGCMFSDVNGPITQDMFSIECQNASAATPAQCLDENDAFLVCMNTVKSPSVTNADCDCSTQYMALETCH